MILQNKKINACLTALCLLQASGCAIVYPFLPETHRRAIAWNSDEAGFYLSILDAIEQALSYEINGDDLHSHQIALRKRLGPSHFEQANMYGKDQLCLADNGLEAWTKALCMPLRAVFPLDPSCLVEDKCLKIQLAPFVASNPKYIITARQAVENPCAFIPDFELLRKRHRQKEPRGGQTTHTANVSAYWLYCDSSRPVKGSASISGDIFTIRWTR